MNSFVKSGVGWFSPSLKLTRMTSVSQPPRRLSIFRLMAPPVSGPRCIRSSAGEWTRAAAAGRNRICQDRPSLLATCRRRICLSLSPFSSPFSSPFPGPFCCACPVDRFLPGVLFAQARTTLQPFDPRACSMAHSMSRPLPGRTTRRASRSIPRACRAGGYGM